MSGGSWIAKPCILPGALAGFDARSDEAEHGGPDRIGVPTRETLRSLLTRFHRTVGGSWPAAAALWAQTDFNIVLVPATALMAAAPHEVVDVAGIDLEYCPTSGLPLRLVLIRPPIRADRGGTALITRLHAHVEHLIGELCGIARLSRRMLQESAGRSVVWALDQLATVPAAPATAIRTLRADFAAIRSFADLPCGSSAPRRFCCLRHQIPGYAGCPLICPRTETLRMPADRPGAA